MRTIKLDAANILTNVLICCEVFVGGGYRFGPEHSSRRKHNLYSIYKIHNLKTNQLLEVSLFLVQRAEKP